MLLGVVRDRDSLVAGERPDEHVGVLLLHQPARLLDRLVGGVVGAAVADDLDVLAGDLGAGDPVGRLVARGGAAGVLDQPQVEARDRRLEERSERALAVRQESNLDRAALLGGAVRGRLVARLVVAATASDETERHYGAAQRQQLACPQNTLPLLLPSVT
jgi:hypothetical protein